MEPFKTYCKQLWILNRVDVDFILLMMNKGRLTAQEADEILEMER